MRPAVLTLAAVLGLSPVAQATTARRQLEVAVTAQDLGRVVDGAAAKEAPPPIDGRGPGGESVRRAAERLHAGAKGFLAGVVEVESWTAPVFKTPVLGWFVGAVLVVGLMPAAFLNGLFGFYFGWRDA